jgi:cation diffusion facilitator family transporter
MDRGRSRKSVRTVAIALAANLGVAGAKLAAALLTGSSALMSEAFHGFADAGNEVLLLVADRRAGAPPDDAHPLGHGREAYFWALVAAVGVFATGSLLSVRQGVRELRHPIPASSFPVAYLVLAVSFGLEGLSLLQAYRQLRREAEAIGRQFLEHLDLSSDPVARAVFAEDAAALVGNLVALVGVALHQATGSPVPDAIASLVIGAVIGFVAVRLAQRNSDFLIGRQASAGLRSRIEAVIVAVPGVTTVSELLVTFIGPRQLWVVARVATDPLDAGGYRSLVRAAEKALHDASPFIARVDVVPRG